MPSLLIVLCVLCETPSASVLSKSAVQNPCCMPCCLFSLSPPILLDSLSPLWGLRLSAVRGGTHMDENSHLLLTLLEGDRGEIMTGKEMRSINKNSCRTVFGSFHRPRSASPFIHVGKRDSPAEGRCSRIWERICGNGREHGLLD